MKKLFFALMVGLGSLSAQSFEGKITHDFSSSLNFTSSSDTLKILAVMVEFQKDKDPNTYGTGKFGSVYTKAYGDTILDPLPHDAAYFNNHLEFAKNYFNKVSGGKLNIVYKILPQIVTVPDSIRNYSPPPKNSTDFSNLGKFAKDVWNIAGTTFLSEDFSKYDLFTVFHAGVGREAPNKYGSLGTERDIPSIYMGLNLFKQIFGNTFSGFAVNGGKFSITNTMFLPATENHEESTNVGLILVQATINSLLVGNIASHIGLPDLFNTTNGKTAIDRFGLMDPQALFAYSGIFPPEPSPWEKIYMGWAQPAVVSIGDKKINLAAKVTAAVNDTTILKIPINSSEYFLVENRQRDAKKDGINITYKIKGVSSTFKLDKDRGRFQWWGVDSVRGVVTDVDEFDWAVPGNGIVIWHIDENIINSKIADNLINADIKQRGVYVEEADGIQDIGTEYFDILAQAYLPRGGSELDLWFDGNKGKYFKNKFAPDTKPNTNSNNGANSLITIENFSALSNKMSFNVKFGSGDVKLFTRTALPLTFSEGHSLIVLYGYDKPNYFVTDGNDLVKFDSDGNLLKKIPVFTSVKPAGIKYEGKQFVIGAYRNVLNIYTMDVSTSAAYSSKNDLVMSFTLPYEISTPISISKKNGNLYLYAVTREGYLLQAGLNSILTSGTVPDDSFQKVPLMSRIYQPFDNSANYYSFTTNLGISDNAQNNVSLAGASLNNILTKDTDGGFVNVTLNATSDSRFFNVTKNGKMISSFPVSSKSITFSLADLFNDGKNFILMNNGKNLEAYNYSGAMADHFPFTEPNGREFIYAPLAADFNNDGVTEIIACTNYGDVYAFNPVTGKVVDGFPISTGFRPTESPVLFADELPTMGPLPSYKPYLAVLDYSKSLYVWNLSPVQGKSYWGGQYGDAMNTSFVPAASSTNKITEFFPLNKTYNWPNPVYGTETKIRYYVNENSNVKIKIFDLAGSLVAEFDEQASGGFDSETIWNVSKVQSGIYYARIEVTGVSGNSASKNIKIAVVK